MKTLTIVVLARLFEQWRQDASENPIRVVDVGKARVERLRW